ncbi:MAG TPA: hypothetical protein V6C89_22080 [Drouetiella sp.]|jgi:nitrate reductase NapE component
MSNPTNTEPSTAEAAYGKSKSAKTKETISFLSTAVPLLGVLGTAFVWGAANFYVGTVDIKPADDYQEITVQVFDQKGVEKEFHTPHFLLEPGHYHMAINVDKKGVQHIETDVKLGGTTNVKVATLQPAETRAAPEKEGHKRWWQIWKKSNPKSDPNTDSKSVPDPTQN